MIEEQPPSTRPLGMYCDRPVEAKGELLYVRPDRLEKRTLTPKPAALILDKGNLTVESGAPIQAFFNVVLQAGAVSPGGALIINDSVTARSFGSIQLFSGTGGILLNAGTVAMTAGDLPIDVGNPDVLKPQFRAPLPDLVRTNSAQHRCQLFRPHRNPPPPRP